MNALDGVEKEALRKELLDLGFDDVRFTDLSPIGTNRLQEWVESGYHADMEWLRRSIEKRLNPDLVLEGACSAIMLGVNYLPSDVNAAEQKRWGKYSLYEDYHDTVLKGLKEAGALLEERFALESRDYRYYVDTGPVMERGWAAASGMGWQGKNGMLISKTHGNWLLLATLLTRVPIVPDPPVKKRLDGGFERAELGALCGKCKRCIDECPTNAIVEPGLLDANRCISYQTIENKGVIPRELRPGIGSRIFGCDICLDICPWNRFAKAGRQVLLAKRYSVVELGLLDVLEMEVEEFREVFRKMPVKRLKLRGLLRNACIVAGNLREESDWSEGRLDSDWGKRVMNSLIRLARYEESMVRPHAVWALFRLWKGEASGLLADARIVEDDEDTIDEYRWWENVLV
ncbi:MAG: epoxyqueuosine reductase [Candidatus Pelagisphaera sp.]|jgi:epoxyqueuosine reductase